MRRTYVIWIVAAFGVLVGAVLAGCGGGGGGSDGSMLQINTTRAGVPGNTTWMAVQDGSGPWTPIQPSTVGQYLKELVDPSGTYGIAAVSLEDNEPVVRILQMTRADGLKWSLSAGDSTGATVTLVPTGVPANNLWYGSMWETDRSMVGNGPLQLEGVPAGTRDCVAALFPAGVGSPPSKMVVHRGHAINGPQNMAVDFTAADAFAPQLFDINAPGGLKGTIINVFLLTNNGAVLRTGRVETTGKYAALPASRRVDGDLYLAYGGEELYPNKIRLAIQAFKAPGDKTLQLPPVFDTASVSTAGAATLKTAWTPYSGADVYEITFEHEGTRSRALSSRDWLVYVSPRWLEASNRVAGLEYTTPDLRGAVGWNAAWNLDVATEIEWMVGAYRGNVNAAQVLGGVDRGVLIPKVDGANLGYSAVIGHHN